MKTLGFRCGDKPTETTPTVIDSFDEHEWLVQSKYDGWRINVYIDGPGKVRILTRTGRPIDQTNAKMHPDFVRGFDQMGLPAGTVIDAEFVGPRGHQKQVVFVFDMLAWDGEWLSQEPYIERWKRCQQLDLPISAKDLFENKMVTSTIARAETVERNFVDYFNHLKDQWDGISINLCEGIVVKAKSGKMKLNRRKSQDSDNMFKCRFRDIRSRRY